MLTQRWGGRISNTRTCWLLFSPESVGVQIKRKGNHQTSWNRNPRIYKCNLIGAYGEAQVLGINIMWTEIKIRKLYWSIKSKCYIQAMVEFLCESWALDLLNLSFNIVFVICRVYCLLCCSTKVTLFFPVFCWGIDLRWRQKLKILLKLKWLPLLEVKLHAGWNCNDPPDTVLTSKLKLLTQLHDNNYSRCNSSSKINVEYTLSICLTSIRLFPFFAPGGRLDRTVHTENLCGREKFCEESENDTSLW